MPIALTSVAALRPSLKKLLLGLSAGLSMATPPSAWSQTAPPAQHLLPSQVLVPPGAPSWLPPSYLSLLQAPLPSLIYPPINSNSVVPQNETDADASGTIGVFQPGGATNASTNAFFLALGTNGRACVTCHAPSNAMGLSTTSINARFTSSGGRDPLFAPVDGATCPRNVPGNLTSGSLVGGVLGLAQSILGGLLELLDPAIARAPYTLLLNKGLIRIPLPVPANAEYTLTVVSDPYGCNTDRNYAQVTNPATGAVTQMVSVYRRPLISANLKYKITTAANSGAFPPVDPLDFSIALPIDPATGQLENGNIMWDGREATLSSQAIDATLSHAQATKAPTAAQVAQMVAFESGIFAAQVADSHAGSLVAGGALGGPVTLANGVAGQFAAPGAEVVSAYDAWNPALGAQSASRQSIYRGQQIFNNRSFTVTNVAGFNDASFVGNVSPKFACSTCHGQVTGTSDPLPMAQHAIGIAGGANSFGGPAPASDLPIFRLSCKPGHQTPFMGATVLTNDPGRALITGKCADIGKFTVPALHGLAARAPYFSDGSAPGLTDLVTFYNTRFNIGLTAQDKTDLVAFLGSL